MSDIIYLMILFVGLFSVLLGALAVLVPKTLTIWDEKLCRRLRLISKCKPVKPAKAEKFILERLLGCLLLVFGIVVIHYLLVESALWAGNESKFTFLANKDSENYNLEQQTPVSPNIPAEGLYIISAKYGTDDKWRDVSRQIREKIRNSTLSIKVSNDIAGDPAFGKVKTLKVEYILDGERNKTQARERQWLHIPSDVQRHPELQAVKTREQLIALIQQCPAEVGFFGKNLKTGETVEHRPAQPACLASIVKIFVLLEVMRQADEGTLELSEYVTIRRKEKEESCTISEALDKMIGISDNEATTALAVRASWDRINALPGELGITGLSDKILPEPGIFGKVLDKRVYGKTRLCAVEDLLPQHGTARGIVRYFELLNSGKLINESVSARVLGVFDRNPKKFAPNATPVDFKSGGKGGSCVWIRPGRPPYNMIGWGVLIRNEESAVAICFWCEWFPEQTSEGLKVKWCLAISDSIVNILLAEESMQTQ